MVVSHGGDGGGKAVFVGAVVVVVVTEVENSEVAGIEVRLDAEAWRGSETRSFHFRAACHDLTTLLDTTLRARFLRCWPVHA